MTWQKGWRCCKHCQGLFFVGATNSCPRGGAHEASGGGGNFLAHFQPTPGAQDGWRWCRRCGVMFYSKLGDGACPLGGGHDPAGSGSYSIHASRPTGLAQTGWKWCKNCQALHNGSALGMCPAANKGRHSIDGSGNYGLNHQIVGDGIAVTYQGAGDNGELWLLLREGTYWHEPIRVPGGLSNTPAPVMFQGKLHMFYQGMGNCRELWTTTFDGINFSDTQRVQDIRLKGAPAAVVHRDMLNVWVQGTNDWGHLWSLRRIASGEWRGHNYGPAIACWNDPAALHLRIGNSVATWALFEWADQVDGGSQGIGRLMLIAADSETVGFGRLDNIRSSATPGIAYFRGLVYVFYEGAGHNGQLWYNVLTPGSDASAAPEVSEARRIWAGISGKPSPVVFGDTLYVFHEGIGDNGELRYVSTTDGQQWTSDQRYPGVGVSDSCGVTTFHFDP